MKAWVEESIRPMGQDRDGNDIYGNIAILVQDEQEEADLVEFLRQHGVPVGDE